MTVSEYEKIYIPKVALEVYEKLSKQLDDLMEKISLYNGDKFLSDYVVDEKNKKPITILISNYEEVMYNLSLVSRPSFNEENQRQLEKVRRNILKEAYEEGSYFIKTLSKIRGFAQYILTFIDRAVGITKAPEIVSPFWYVAGIIQYLVRHYKGYYVNLPPDDVIALLAFVKTHFESLIKMVPRITPNTIQEEEIRPILLRFFFRKECGGCEELFRNQAFRYLIDLIGKTKKYEIIFHDCTIPESILVALTCGATLGDLELYSFRVPKSGVVESKIKLLKVSAVTPTLCGLAGVHTFIDPSQPYEVKSALERLGLVKLASLLPYRFAKMKYVKRVVDLEAKQKVATPPPPQPKSEESQASAEKSSASLYSIRFPPIIYNGEKYVYIGEVVKITKYKRTTLRNYIYKGRISAIKVDKRYWYLRESDLLSDMYISRRYVPSSTPPIRISQSRVSSP